jgi:YVTN family beta-propeller protein
MSRFAGQSLRVHIGTYNNGAGGISRTVVDDASLVACLPAVTPTHTPTPTATPTATAIPTAIPTATPGFVPTPYWAGQLNLPAGSRPHGVAVNEAGDLVYVAFHGVNHSGRTLGVVNETLSLQAQIDLGPAGQGPNGVAVIAGSGRVVVANRQTANASVVDPVAGTVVQTIAANLLPDGVIVVGDYGYIANFGNDTVTVFDPATLAVIRTLHGIGHEPALLAGDPESGDVFLTAHGSDQIFHLRDGQVIGQWNGVTAPYGISYDPAGRRLYVANRGAVHTVTVIDVYLDQIVGTISTGKEPFVLLVNPASGHLFVACGDEVRVYDTYDWSLVTSIPVPPGAEEGIAFEPRLSKVFVASRDSDALTVIQDQGPAQVVFASSRHGNGDIFRMLPDGRRQVRLTFTDGAAENAPAGSPDGRWIAYERTDSGNPAYTQIWLMSRDGRGATMLTDGPFNNLHPTWSPDSRQIALASDRDGDWEIYVLDLATRGLVKLTDNTWFDVQPDWSKATGRIAFVSNRNSPNSEIFTMAADGSDVRPLLVNINGDASPSWSPGGQQLVFWGSRPAGQALVHRAQRRQRPALDRAAVAASRLAGLGRCGRRHRLQRLPARQRLQRDHACRGRRQRPGVADQQRGGFRLRARLAGRLVVDDR